MLHTRYDRYITCAIVSLETGLEAINHPYKYTMVGGKSVGVSSLRLKTFATKGTCCKYCDLEAVHFTIDKCHGSQKDIWHMNLWGIRDGKEILFTHDHVHARSLGGADDITNSVTACETCNSRKSKFENKILNYMRQEKLTTISFDELIDMARKMWQSPKVENILKFFPIKV